MPATEYQGSFLGRISLRRNQVTAMDTGTHEQDLQDLDNFQKNIADHFSGLLSPPDSFLSIAWLRKLLDVYLHCEAEFKAFLIAGKDTSAMSKPPLDRLIPDLLDRAVKALDVCNAVMHGVDSVRQCQKLAEIAVAALDQRQLSDGHVRRAKKVLTCLVTAMSAVDGPKDGSSHKSAERSWSFGRRGGGGSKDRGSGQFRSPSWGVSKNWSAAKQIQAMTANLTLPRGTDASGLGLPVYVMSMVTVFVMWALVAAVPCQDRTGLAFHAQIPRQVWAQPMMGLHEKISEEWKKKGSSGLMKELQRMEKSGQSLIDLAESFQFPGDAEQLEKAAAQTAEMTDTCRRMEEGLVPLQQHIREVFHRIIRSRTALLDSLDHSRKEKC